jgi:hypothetical protein
MGNGLEKAIAQARLRVVARARYCLGRRKAESGDLTRAIHDAIGQGLIPGIRSRSVVARRCRVIDAVLGWDGIEGRG